MSEVAVLTLSEFLLARIAEQEAAASRLHPEEALGVHFSGEVEPVIVIRARDVLAECAAKRAIVDDARIRAVRLTVAIEQLVDYRVLRHLASAYVDHPDYRDEWKP